VAGINHDDGIREVEPGTRQFGGVLGRCEGDLVEANPAGVVAVVDELQPLAVAADDGKEEALMGADVRLARLGLAIEIGPSGGNDGRPPRGGRGV
jgi:hypothetical protein